MRLIAKLFFVSLVCFFLSAGSAAFAQTPDGEPPSVETVCNDQVGAAFGLCNAYCEAMDCDSGEPQASENACNRVLSKFEQLTGTTPPCDAFCGNGIIEGNEECDEGPNNGGATCNIDCTLPAPPPPPSPI